MALRILLYLLTNLLVVLTISLVLSLLTAPGNSGPMPAALRRLSQASGLIDRRDGGALNTLKIAAPRSWIALFASHPPLEARIEALQVAQLAGSASLAAR